jgi:hypothetical protein
MLFVTEWNVSARAQVDLSGHERVHDDAVHQEGQARGRRRIQSGGQEPLRLPGCHLCTQSQRCVCGVLKGRYRFSGKGRGVLDCMSFVLSKNAVKMKFLR